MSRGKKFEAAVREAFEKCPEVSVDRLPDPTGGYAGVRNICDFVFYRYPFLLFVECKVQQGNTLNFKGRITENQWGGLLEKSKIPGVIAGVMVWFVDHDKTVFVPIQELAYIRDIQQKKSLSALNLGDVNHLTLEGRKKRIFFDYDARTFLRAAHVWGRHYWNDEITWGKRP